MLTQLSSVKKRLVGILPADTLDDAILTNAILAVSGRAELECSRSFCRTAGATFEFGDSETEIVPDCLPIESIAGFDQKLNETDGWIAQLPVPDYLVRKVKGVGIAISLSGPFGNGRGIGRVTYTGGYVLPGTVAAAGQTPLPSVIEQACIEQVVYWYQNKDRLGIVTTSGGGASVSQFHELDLLPFVKQVLRKYRRLNL